MNTLIEHIAQIKKNKKGDFKTLKKFASLQ